ncbi:hypothetical protein [Weissella sagaensis]|uniref:hypothetical protein n=1 Tax=Weissella sagaensis TaxID=2559928 RepID=UPI0013EDB32B|nr:hypothetical protein [Weissella sagaensis]
MKKINECLKKHPLSVLFVTAIIVGLLKMFINTIQRRPIYEELDGVIYIFGVYLVCWIIAKIIHNTYIRLGVVAFITFIYLSIDGSYVNFTSFIVTGGVAILIAVIIVFTIHIIEKQVK